MDSRLRRYLLECLEHDLTFEGKGGAGAAFYAAFRSVWRYPGIYAGPRVGSNLR